MKFVHFSDTTFPSPPLPFSRQAINNRLAELEAIASRQEAERKAGLHRTIPPGRSNETDSSGGDGYTDTAAQVPRGTGTNQGRLFLGMLWPWRWGRSVPTVGENAESFENSRDIAPPKEGGEGETAEGFESSRDVALPRGGGQLERKGGGGGGGSL